MAESADVSLGKGAVNFSGTALILDGSVPGVRMFGLYRDCFVEICGLADIVACHVFFGFDERPVGEEHFAGSVQQPGGSDS